MQMGRYELIRRLAAGGMAEVFLAKAAGPMGFEKMLVVKRILPHLAEDPQFVDMFLSEAKLAAKLCHENVAQIFDFGLEDDGSYFIAMEYVDGPNLRTLSKRAFEQGAAIPFPLCAKLISLACEGLAYAHELADPETGEPLNLVHRDISPDNVLLSRNGGVKVVDFGIAKAANQAHRTRTGILKGKLAYMSPEQVLLKPIDARADVYALGVVLYELVVGQKPFDAESEVGLLRAILEQPLPPPRTLREEVPERLERIILKALEKEREARYRSCRELQGELERFLLKLGEPVGRFQLAELVERLAPSIGGSTQGTPPPGSRPRSPARPPPPPPPTQAEKQPAAVPPPPGGNSGEAHLATQEVRAPAAERGARRSLRDMLLGAVILFLASGGGYASWRLWFAGPSGGAAQPPPQAGAPGPIRERPPPPVVPAPPPAVELARAEPGPPADAVVPALDKKHLVHPETGESEGRVRDDKKRVRSASANGTHSPKKRTMVIRVRPDDLPVVLDGRPLGSRPKPQEVSEGPHTIEVRDPKSGKSAACPCPPPPPPDASWICGCDTLEGAIDE